MRMSNVVVEGAAAVDPVTSRAPCDVLEVPHSGAQVMFPVPVMFGRTTAAAIVRVPLSAVSASSNVPSVPCNVSVVRVSALTPRGEAALKRRRLAGVVEQWFQSPRNDGSNSIRRCVVFCAKQEVKAVMDVFASPTFASCMVAGCLEDKMPAALDLFSIFSVPVKDWPSSPAQILVVPNTQRCDGVVTPSVEVAIVFDVPSCLELLDPIVSRYAVVKLIHGENASVESKPSSSALAVEGASAVPSDAADNSLQLYLQKLATSGSVNLVPMGEQVSSPSGAAAATEATSASAALTFTLAGAAFNSTD